MSLIDLHVHSNHSDGSDSPGELVRLAGEAGVTAFALTDHDTLTGLPEAVAAGSAAGIEVIPGVELSCHTSRRTIHVLGYFLDITDRPLQELLADQRTLRGDRNLRLARRLQNIGVSISVEEAQAVAGNDSTGRPHFAAVLVRKGYARTIDEAFATYLAEGRPGYVQRAELAVIDAVRIVHAAGGVAVWAHPFRRSEERYDDIKEDLDEIVEAGVDGMECWYGRYSQDVRRQLVRMARKSGIVPSGGSDYHGTYKRDLFLGVGVGDLRVPESALTELRSRIRPFSP